MGTDQPDRHPFAREGLVRRVLPFAIGALLGLALVIPAAMERGDRVIGVVAAVSLGLAAAAFGIPWARLPRWCANLVPLAYLVIVVSFGRVGGTNFAPLILLPLFWLAMYGTRRELVLGFVVLVAALSVRAALGGFLPHETQFRALALIVSAIICFTTQALMRRHRDGERTLRELLDHLPIGVAVDRAGTLRYANDALARMIGQPALVDRPTAGLFEGAPPLDGPPRDVRMVRADAGELLADLVTVPTQFEGQPGTVLLLRDVSDERWLEAAQQEMRDTIAAERRRLEGIFESIDVGVAFLDANRTLVYANRAYAEIFALDRARLIGMTREAFVAHVATLTDEADELLPRLAALSPEAGPTPEEFRFARPVGRIFDRTVKPLDVDGQRGYLVIWQDVTAERELATVRESQAMTDPLTGLYNRRGAEQTFAREVARARRGIAPFCVALFDLDHFKQMNDTHGHAAGDAVLKWVAERLRREARPFDAVARWGGEEFLVVVSGPLESARAYCERVRSAIAGADSPGGARVTISAGVAAFSPDEELSATLARADARLYEAKTAGRNTVKG